MMMTDDGGGLRRQVVGRRGGWLVVVGAAAAAAAAAAAIAVAVAVAVSSSPWWRRKCLHVTVLEFALSELVQGYTSTGPYAKKRDGRDGEDQELEPVPNLDPCCHSSLAEPASSPEGNRVIGTLAYAACQKSLNLHTINL